MDDVMVQSDFIDSYPDEQTWTTACRVVAEDLVDSMLTPKG